VEDEGAQEPEVTARASEDPVLAFGVPAGDAILEFGRAVEVDLLRALNGPVLEDAVAAGAGVALDGGRVGAAALEGLGDDAGVSAEGVERGQALGITKLAGDAGGKYEADAGDAGEHGIGRGGEGEGGFGAELQRVAVEAAVKVDRGGKGALEGVYALGCGRQRLAGERDDLCRRFLRLVRVVAAQQRGERGLSATGDFRRAEAFGHEFEGSFAECGEAAFGVTQEAGEELVGKRVEAVGGGGLLADEVATAAVDLAEVMIDGGGHGGLPGDARAPGEECFGNAEEVEVVGAGEQVLAAFLGLIRVDPDDEVTFVAKGGGKVRDISGLVLAAEIDAVFGGDLLDEIGDSSRGVLDREGGFEDVAVTVADQGDVLGFCIVQGNAEDLSGTARTLEKGADEDVLVAVDR
jgi:hypothetical protein